MNPTYEIYPSAVELVAAAAERFSARAEDAVSRHGRFTVALAGGSTPRPLYHLLTRPPYRDRVPWHATHVFWSDERHVPPGSAESNYRMARETLLDHVPVPREQVHRMGTDRPPSEGAEAYSHLVANVVGEDGLDLVILGMGADGHTASIFPGVSAALVEGRGAAACFVPQLRAWRLTLTVGEINRAASVMVLIADSRKAEAVADIRTGRSSLPAARIKPTQGELYWMLDRPTADEMSLADARRPGSVDGHAADLEVEKRAAGEAAAQEVVSDTVVGLGTGSTARYAVEAIARRLATGAIADVVGIPTSERTARLARDGGIPLTTLAAHPRTQITIDGADEIAPRLDLIKGLGAALLREKIVAAATDRLVIVSDSSKVVGRIGARVPLPVAVVPFAWEVHLSVLRAWGAEPTLRTEAGEPVITDDGLYILDCRFHDGISDPEALQRDLRSHPGIVETGMFLGMARSAYVADRHGVLVYRR